LEVVGESHDGKDTVEKAKELKPDVVLMDIGMPNLNGLEATRQIKKHNPNIKVLILTIHKNEEYIFQSLQTGASGYLLKDTAVEDLISAIHSVYKDDSFLSPGISKTVIDAFLRKSSKERVPTAFDTLTPREREILQLIAEGHTNPEIAKRLYISKKTVEAHRSHIMEKLDIHDVVDLVKYAIRKGIVTLDT
jgi:RNA polymerase sigma factor (sigma-70 family)